MKYRLHTVLAGLGCVAVSWLAHSFLSHPFLVILPLWCAFFAALSLFGKLRVFRLLCFSVSMTLAIFTVGEAVLAGKDDDDMLGKPEEPPQVRSLHPLARAQGIDDRGTGEIHKGKHDRYFQIDDRFGYAPAPNDRVEAMRLENHEVLYDVVYQFDTHGLRRTPQAGESGDECILFFGGSFMFGQGVADDETLPARVGQKTGGRFRAYNFGFHGYGPHQMLYALDHEVVDGIVECRPALAVYLAIPAHVKRSAGRTWWGRHGPRYVLDQRGEPVYRGRFDDAGAVEPVPRSLGYRLLSSSRLFSEIHRGTVIYGENVDLLVAIVDAARRRFETRWPGAEFHVLFWDKRFQPRTLRLEWALAERGLRMHRISEILPDYFGNELRYQLSEAEGHPNALAFELMAGHVASLASGLEAPLDKN